MHAYFVWVFGASLLLLVLELLAGRHRSIYKKADFLLLLGNILLGRNVMAVISTGLVAWFYSVMLPGFEGGLQGKVSFWLAFPLLLLIDEFFFYWVHRYAHEGARRDSRLSGLWKLHRTHHSAKHMNVLVNYRLNLFWYLVIPSAWVAGLALYLGLGDAVLSVILVKMVWNLLTHSNFRWDDNLRRFPVIGKAFWALEHVLVSPGIHHTHHGYGRDGKNYRNFGVVLSVYDWLFGTLHIPVGRPAHYGLPGPNAHWLEELLFPLVSFDRRKEKPAAASLS